MAEVESTPSVYEAGGQTFCGAFVARAGVEPLAACVLLPDWRGQSPLAHDHARFLVEQGCAVVIGDLYGGGFSPTESSQVGEMVKRLIEYREQGVDALAECVSALRARVSAGLPIFCLGYSAGGMVALDYVSSFTDSRSTRSTSPKRGRIQRRASFIRPPLRLGRAVPSPSRFGRKRKWATLRA